MKHFIQDIFVADGVSLKLQGVVIPNNSIVDIDEILYTALDSCCNKDPSNHQPDLHDQALLCVTDLVDCCESPHTVHGDWYYPNGSIVPFNAVGLTFQKNRGPNQIINGRQFYGSVRLFRRGDRPPGRGHFYCELPDAALTYVTLYANIGEFTSLVFTMHNGLFYFFYSGLWIQCFN